MMALNGKHGTLIEQNHRTAPIPGVGSHLRGREAHTNLIVHGTCANVRQLCSLEMVVRYLIGGVADV
jgi:hypothetical protein